MLRNMDSKTLLSILEKDYQELTHQELNFLRNATREKYHWQGTIEAETLLQSYLLFKRREMTSLEVVFIEPRSHRYHGTFNNFNVVNESPIINTFDGINRDHTGSFNLTSGRWFGVLTVFYFEDYTEVICLNDDGHFFRVSSKDFSFTI